MSRGSIFVLHPLSKKNVRGSPKGSPVAPKGSPGNPLGKTRFPRRISSEPPQHKIFSRILLILWLLRFDISKSQNFIKISTSDVPSKLPFPCNKYWYFRNARLYIRFPKVPRFPKMVFPMRKHFFILWCLFAIYKALHRVPRILLGPKDHLTKYDFQKPNFWNLGVEIRFAKRLFSIPGASMKLPLCFE